MESILKIYCINLFESHERKERMMRRFINAKLQDKVSFVDAISDKSAYINYYEEDLKDVNRRIIGCFASHLKAVRLFLEDAPIDEVSYAIICEDDIMLDNDFHQRLKEIWNNKPDGCPLISLSYLIWYWEDLEWSGKDPSKENLSTMNWDTWGTQMYLISSKYAQEVLENYDQPFRLIDLDDDDILTSELITRKSDGYIAYPPLALEEIGESTVDPDHTNHLEALEGFDYANYSNFDLEP